MKQQCWEFLNCPPESKSRCPAYPDKGQDCWKVPGTFCRGKQQGSVEEKREFCLFDCKFVNYITKPE